MHSGGIVIVVLPLFIRDSCVATLVEGCTELIRQYFKDLANANI